MVTLDSSRVPWLLHFAQEVSPSSTTEVSRDSLEVMTPIIARYFGATLTAPQTCSNLLRQSTELDIHRASKTTTSPRSGPMTKSTPSLVESSSSVLPTKSTVKSTLMSPTPASQRVRFCVTFSTPPTAQPSRAACLASTSTMVRSKSSCPSQAPTGLIMPLTSRSRSLRSKLMRLPLLISSSPSE